eukprot:6186245-Pleurochrysis_carterae.AAC.1
MRGRMQQTTLDEASTLSRNSQRLYSMALHIHQCKGLSNAPTLGAKLARPVNSLPHSGCDAMQAGRKRLPTPRKVQSSIAWNQGNEIQRNCLPDSTQLTTMKSKERNFAFREVRFPLQRRLKNKLLDDLPVTSSSLLIP